MNCHKYVTATLGAIREEERLAEEEGRAWFEALLAEGCAVAAAHHDGASAC